MKIQQVCQWEFANIIFMESCMGHVEKIMLTICVYLCVPCIEEKFFRNIFQEYLLKCMESHLRRWWSTMGFPIVSIIFYVCPIRLSIYLLCSVWLFCILELNASTESVNQSLRPEGLLTNVIASHHVKMLHMMFHTVSLNGQLLGMYMDEA